jgi:hypothetical protein
MTEWDIPPHEEPPSDDGYFEDWDSDPGPPPFEDDAPPVGVLTPPAGSPTPKETPLSVQVIDTLRSVLAAQDKRLPAELAQMVREILASPQVLNQLSDDVKATYDGVLEILLDCGLSLETGVVDLTDLPSAKLYADDVQAELALIESAALEPQVGHPSAAWQALRENVQRTVARRKAHNLMVAIDARSTVSELMEKFHELEPPTTKRSITRTKSTRTARELMEESRAAKAGAPPVRFSSGYRTLDIALTGSGEPLGWIAPGEGTVVAGPTGTGKTSFSYGMIPGMVQDMINWGFPYAKGIFLHTEEEPEVKIRGFRMDVGQAFHHLADNLVVQNVGTSRQLMAMTIYDTVIDAVEQHLRTGLPVMQFLPPFVVLDYIQSIMEQGENEVVATKNTAEFLLRGVQAWNPDEMAKFSGVDFQSYAGMPWPDGMEHHRVAGVYFAQLVKQDDKSLLYRPGHRDSPVSDFTLEDTRSEPAWKDEGGNGWCWEVREGDLRLFKQNAIRGSGVILQNATNIIILHRSKPYTNPAVTGPDGRRVLMDDRARLILDKTRNGSAMPYVPMSFNLQEEHEGFQRAQYFDVLAEEAMARGDFTPHECFARSGDPILRPRPQMSPLVGHQY